MCNLWLKEKKFMVEEIKRDKADMRNESTNGQKSMKKSSKMWRWVAIIGGI